MWELRATENTERRSPTMFINCLSPSYLSIQVYLQKIPLSLTLTIVISLSAPNPASIHVDWDAAEHAPISLVIS